MSAEGNKRLYERWLLELWNGDLTVAEEVIAPDFVGSWPGEPGKVRGRDGLVDIIRQSREYFDDLRFEIEIGPIAENDLVAARWTGRDSAADAGRFSLSGHDILRVQDACSPNTGSSPRAPANAPSTPARNVRAACGRSGSYDPSASRRSHSRGCVRDERENLAGAAPGQAHARSTVPVVVIQRAPPERLLFHSDGRTGGAKADAVLDDGRVRDPRLDLGAATHDALGGAGSGSRLHSSASAFPPSTTWSPRGK